MPNMHRPSGFDVVAIVLAVGLAVTVWTITIGVLYDAIISEGPGLSDNATQVLTATLGGIIGVLGSYVGYRVSQQQTDTAARNAEIPGPGDMRPPPAQPRPSPDPGPSSSSPTP
jgi:hypothetical protein